MPRYGGKVINKNKYTSKEMKMFENGYVYDENHNLVKDPNIETPVRVLNPLTQQMIKLYTLYQKKEFLDGKMEYDLQTNTVIVVDETLQAEIQKRLDDGLIEKLNERREKREKKEKEKKRKELREKYYQKRADELGMDVDEYKWAYWGIHSKAYWEYRFQPKNPYDDDYDDSPDY